MGVPPAKVTHPLQPVLGHEQVGLCKEILILACTGIAIHGSGHGTFGDVRVQSSPIRIQLNFQGLHCKVCGAAVQRQQVICIRGYRHLQ